MDTIGWYNERYLWERYYWRFRMSPSVLTAAQERERAATPGSELKECANGCPTMVVIPPGKFIMGSPETEVGRFADESPQHEVTIKEAFAVSKFDVTFTEWDVCVAAGGCPSLNDGGFGRNDRPVINVSWNDATTYMNWLARITGKAYRLLTEAEYEYAARSGSTTAFSWGDEVGNGRRCSRATATLAA